MSNLELFQLIEKGNLDVIIEFLKDKDEEYINMSNQKEYYEYIISLHPERVIFNPGTENPEFYSLLKANNIETEVACTLVLLATNQF